MLLLLTAAGASVSLSLVVLLSCLLASPAPAGAQIGSDCSEVVPCTGNQECSLGYCRCTQGFVKLNKECLPERAFNETCDFDDQCVDFRLKCSGGLCACVKYYHWDEYSRQCLTYKDLKYMLSDMDEKYDSEGRLMVETSMVFMGMLWTGLAVMVIGLVLAAGCVFYGCFYGRFCCCPRDKLSPSSRLPGDTSGQLTQRTRETSAPCSSTNTGRENRAASLGTGIDYIPALYKTTSFHVV